jgi:hypothetical protein
MPCPENIVVVSMFELMICLYKLGGGLKTETLVGLVGPTKIEGCDYCSNFRTDCCIWLDC